MLNYRHSCIILVGIFKGNLDALKLFHNLKEPTKTELVEFFSFLEQDLSIKDIYCYKISENSVNTLLQLVTYNIVLDLFNLRFNDHPISLDSIDKACEIKILKLLIYDILLKIFKNNVNFNVFFNNRNNIYRLEVSNFIDFVKKNNFNDNILNYNISKEALCIIFKAMVFDIFSDLANSNQKKLSLFFENSDEPFKSEINSFIEYAKLNSRKKYLYDSEISDRSMSLILGFIIPFIFSNK